MVRYHSNDVGRRLCIPDKPFWNFLESSIAFCKCKISIIDFKTSQYYGFEFLMRQNDLSTGATLYDGPIVDVSEREMDKYRKND
jgi:hypothetical protein